MITYIYLVSCIVLVRGGSATDNQKDQYCTDPRTMRKHAAYTEWADAYSCTRHRCQPGGRNLAIYTVGCKRVEAPESAIECEEVVEDTNMQFPYCCTRLRCLVVVRGEVWTRVLGQPWETLPAAPWSHMYKMKKPPPVDGGFQPKDGVATGPVYELADPNEKSDTEQVMRAKEDYDKPVARAAASAPDIVIALTTNSESKPTGPDIQRIDQHNEVEPEEQPTSEKVALSELASEERMYPPDRFREHKVPGSITSDEQGYNRGSKTNKVDEPVSEEHLFSDGDKRTSRGQKTWAKIPQDQWNTNKNIYTQPRAYDIPVYEKEQDNAPKVNKPAYPGETSDEKSEKPGSLQNLVNAIGTRMRDIENVVQQMSEKVQPPKEDSGERKDQERALDGEMLGKRKKPYSENYNRFPPHTGAGSRYLHSGLDGTTEPPLFVEDTNMNGYYSDPSNNLLRRSNIPKEPPPDTYMVPINTGTRRKNPAPEVEVPVVKHKKHSHKKKKSKHGRKKHHKEDKEKKFNQVPPAEVEKNVVSLEDNTDTGKA